MELLLEGEARQRLEHFLAAETPRYTSRQCGLR